MYCNNCGTQNADGVKFCSNCGAPLNAHAQNPTVSNQNPYGVQPNVLSEPPKKSNGKTIGIICGVAFAVIAVIVAVVLALTLGGKDKKKEGESESNKPSSKVEDVQKPTESKTEEPSTEPAMSYQETALAYVKAVFEGDLLTAKSYCLLDMTKIAEKAVKVSGSDLNELYSEIAEGYSEELGKTVEIKSIDDMYRVVGKEIEDGMSDYKIGLKITETELVDLTDSNNKNYLIADIVGCDWVGNIISESNYSEYIDINKISEAYEVEVEFTVDNGAPESESYYVVNYNGSWRVVSDPLCELF